MADLQCTSNDTKQQLDDRLQPQNVSICNLDISTESQRHSQSKLHQKSKPKWKSKVHRRSRSLETVRNETEYNVSVNQDEWQFEYETTRLQMEINHLKHKQVWFLVLFCILH